jgi:hypothetical protein
MRARLGRVLNEASEIGGRALWLLFVVGMFGLVLVVLVGMVQQLMDLL